MINSDNGDHEHTPIKTPLKFHRLSSESSSHTNVEYFTKKLTNPDSDLAGLKSLTTPLGGAITLDLEEIG